MKKLVTNMALAFAVISLASVTASAQVTPAAGATDLILGFQATTAASTGANTNLEFDLGPAANFTSAASFNNLGLLGADLTAVYGANWATRTDLLWSVAGLVTAGKVFDLTSNTVPTERSGYTTSYIGGLVTTINTASAAPLTGSGAAKVGSDATPASGIGGSYSNSLVGGGNGDFGITSMSVGQSQGGGAGGTDGTLNLYHFVQAGGTSTPATLLGDFVLSGSGTSATFAFNPQAVPEPSSYALTAVGVVFLVVVLRRRNKIA